MGDLEVRTLNVGEEASGAFVAVKSYDAQEASGRPRRPTAHSHREGTTMPLLSRRKILPGEPRTGIITISAPPLLQLSERSVAATARTGAEDR